MNGYSCVPIKLYLKLQVHIIFTYDKIYFHHLPLPLLWCLQLNLGASHVLGKVSPSTCIPSPSFDFFNHLKKNIKNYPVNNREIGSGMPFAKSCHTSPARIT